MQFYIFFYEKTKHNYKNDFLVKNFFDLNFKGSQYSNKSEKEKFENESIFYVNQDNCLYPNYTGLY